MSSQRRFHKYRKNYNNHIKRKKEDIQTEKERRQREREGGREGKRERQRGTLHL